MRIATQFWYEQTASIHLIYLETTQPKYILWPFKHGFLTHHDDNEFLAW